MTTNSLSNLDSQIAASRRKLTTLQDSIRRDAAQFEKDRAALFTADGKQLYNTDIHAEKMSALVERATSAAQATIVQIVTEQEHLATLQQAARAESLSLMGYSAEELQRATALRPFIEADVATLDARNLTANVHAAVHGGDRVAAMLYLRLLPARYDEAARGKADWWSGELDVLYREMQGAAAKHVDDVEATRQLSIDVQLDASNLRRVADGTYEKAQSDFARDVRSW